MELDLIQKLIFSAKKVFIFSCLLSIGFHVQSSGLHCNNNLGLSIKKNNDVKKNMYPVFALGMGNLTLVGLLGVELTDEPVSKMICLGLSICSAIGCRYYVKKVVKELQKKDQRATGDDMV